MGLVAEQIVYVVDDDDAVRDSIYELACSVGLTAKGYAGAQEFLAELMPEQAGCLILDIRMAKMSGLALQKALNEQGASIPIIFITAYGDVPTAVEAMKAGAIDFIQKPYRDQQLLDSINNALNYDLEKRAHSSGLAQLEEGLSALTNREKEVMVLMMSGAATKRVADELAISPRTVEIHRQRVLHKLGLRSISVLREKAPLLRSML
jgi:FixJ family two-component response regulator